MSFPLPNASTDLSGQTALVTGASRGIGAATARAAHREGAAVVAHYGANSAAAQRLADEFGGGYLGPTVNGPAVTFVTDLRTFAIPLGTPPGTYRYSYGVDLFPTVGGAGTILYDSLLTIHVIPEPSSWVLLMVAFGALGAVLRERARTQFGCPATRA